MKKNPLKYVATFIFHEMYITTELKLG